MSIFVFNHPISREQFIVEAVSVSKDCEVIYNGPKTDFDKLGFNDSHIGGLELSAGKLVFNQAKKTAYDTALAESRKSIAMGSELALFMKRLIKNRAGATLQQKSNWWKSVQDLLDLMNSNGLSQADFTTIKDEIGTRLTAALFPANQIAAVKAQMDTWASDKKFT